MLAYFVFICGFIGKTSHRVCWKSHWNYNSYDPRNRDENSAILKAFSVRGSLLASCYTLWTPTENARYTFGERSFVCEHRRSSLSSSLNVPQSTKGLKRKMEVPVKSSRMLHSAQLGFVKWYHFIQYIAESIKQKNVINSWSNPTVGASKLNKLTINCKFSN